MEIDQQEEATSSSSKQPQEQQAGDDGAAAAATAALKTTTTSPTTSSHKTEYRSFKILIISSLLFVIASAAYLIAAIMDLEENEKPLALQGISASWILLLVGATSFIFVGLLDFYNQYYNPLQLFLTLAGIFGTISAATSADKDLTLSLVCNLLAAHLFLLESLSWIYGHLMYSFNLQQQQQSKEGTDEDMDSSIRFRQKQKRSLLVAEFGDFCFFLGAFMDVIFSYFYLLNEQGTLIATEDLMTSSAELISAIFWMIASLAQLSVTCQLGKQGFETSDGDYPHHDDDHDTVSSGYGAKYSADTSGGGGGGEWETRLKLIS